ncbi:MAG: HEAT repeat domain-containing protein, partial [Planctomycetota bacterium]
ERLVEETELGNLEEERIAATLALGELGAPRLASALDHLVRLTRDGSDGVAEAALVALLRSYDDAAARRVAEIAASGGERADAAIGVLAHFETPESTDVPPAWQTLYILRWDAACSFGLVDGRVWGTTLLEELSRDDRFLSALVLRMLERTPVDGAKDHLLEVLTDGEGLARIGVAVQLMPSELELLVDSGAWRPASTAEWTFLVRRALEAEYLPFLQRTFALALDVDSPLVQTIAAGVLHRGQSRFEDIVSDGLVNEKADVRADAAYVVGQVGLTEHLRAMESLTVDPNPWVAANALGSLIRMGSRPAASRAVDLLAAPPDERPPLLSEYLFEVLARAAPDPDVMTFVETVADGLTGLDRAAADSILLVNGIVRDTSTVRAELPLMNPLSPLAVRCARGLSRSPSQTDLGMLQRLFPRQEAQFLNLELAVGLASSGNRRPLQLLESAVWRLPWNESVLAAGLVHRIWGEDVLIDWVEEPPANATVEDLRRVGWAIGEYGGLRGVDKLKAALGTTSGAERPAVQGAVLGALSGRTR